MKTNLIAAEPAENDDDDDNTDDVDVDADVYIYIYKYVYIWRLGTDLLVLCEPFVSLLLESLWRSAIVKPTQRSKPLFSCSRGLVLLEPNDGMR